MTSVGDVMTSLSAATLSVENHHINVFPPQIKYLIPYFSPDKDKKECKYSVRNELNFLMIIEV